MAFAPKFYCVRLSSGKDSGGGAPARLSSNPAVRPEFLRHTGVALVPPPATRVRQATNSGSPVRTRLPDRSRHHSWRPTVPDCWLGSPNHPAHSRGLPTVAQHAAHVAPLAPAATIVATVPRQRAQSRDFRPGPRFSQITTDICE
jgi:hypothetical protein